jgi:hypothetical protein
MSDAIDAAKKPKPEEPKIQLQLVKVKEPVPFQGPADQTLMVAHGTLELDARRRVVIATPKVVEKGRVQKDAIEIPLENVVFFVRLTEKHVAKIEAEKVAAPAPAPRPAPLPPGVRPKGDTVKFVRKPDGSIGEETV